MPTSSTYADIILEASAAVQRHNELTGSRPVELFMSIASERVIFDNARRDPMATPFVINISPRLIRWMDIPVTIDPSIPDHSVYTVPRNAHPRYSEPLLTSGAQVQLMTHQQGSIDRLQRLMRESQEAAGRQRIEFDTETTGLRPDLPPGIRMISPPPEGISGIDAMYAADYSAMELRLTADALMGRVPEWSLRGAAPSRAERRAAARSARAEQGGGRSIMEWVDRCELAMAQFRSRHDEDPNYLMVSVRDRREIPFLDFAGTHFTLEGGSGSLAYRGLPVTGEMLIQDDRVVGFNSHLYDRGVGQEVEPQGGLPAPAPVMEDAARDSTQRYRVTVGPEPVTPRRWEMPVPPGGDWMASPFRPQPIPGVQAARPEIPEERMREEDPEVAAVIRRVERMKKRA